MHNCRYLGMSIDVQYDLHTLAGHLLMQRAVCLFNPKCRAQRRLKIESVVGMMKEIFCVPTRQVVPVPVNPRC